MPPRSKAVSVWKSIAEKTPEPVTDVLKHSWLWYFYFRVLYVISARHRQLFETPAGQLELELLTSEFAAVEETYEPVLSRAIVDELDSSSVFYDIGAGFGYFAALAKASGVPADKIHAFEAAPFRYWLCHSNVPDITINNGFVGKNSQQGHISIDNYVQSNKSPEVVKIDVEGAEMAVLHGMSETIRQKQPTIFVEVHPRLLRREGFSPSDIISLLADHGYDLAVTDHRSKEEEGWIALDQPSDIEKYELPRLTYLVVAK